MNQTRGIFLTTCFSGSWLFIFLICSISSFGQSIDSQPETIDCGLFVEGGLDAPSENPVLSGRVFAVPDLRFFISPSERRSAFGVKQIKVFYIWEWFRFPYPDRANGAWDEAVDIVECNSIPTNMFTIPSFSVRPRGWYSGKFANTGKNLPRFVRVEISFEIDDCGTQRLKFSPKELDRFGKSRANVQITCGAPPKYTFQR
ncbi:MAG: hypothetical protein IPM50_01290 [Acidobacteriota bacterium]|nr:MAG: hypothetical protein IPM50_01290 [Acidobacteriota bacterium]